MYVDIHIYIYIFICVLTTCILYIKINVQYPIWKYSQKGFPPARPSHAHPALLRAAPTWGGMKWGESLMGRYIRSPVCRHSTTCAKYTQHMTNTNKYWASFWSPVGYLRELSSKSAAILKVFAFRVYMRLPKINIYITQRKNAFVKNCQFHKSHFSTTHNRCVRLDELVCL